MRDYPVFALSHLSNKEFVEQSIDYTNKTNKTRRNTTWVNLMER